MIETASRVPTVSFGSLQLVVARRQGPAGSHRSAELCHGKTPKRHILSVLMLHLHPVCGEKHEEKASTKYFPTTRRNAEGTKPLLFFFLFFSNIHSSFPHQIYGTTASPDT